MAPFALIFKQLANKWIRTKYVHLAKDRIIVLPKFDFHDLRQHSD